VGIEHFKRFFMMREYSVDEKPDALKFAANKMLSGVWLDYFKPELTYYQGGRQTVDLTNMHGFLQNNRFKVSQSIDAAKLLHFLCNSSAIEQRPAIMLPFDSDRQVEEMNIMGVDASMRFSEFFRIATSSFIQGAKSMLLVE
jgi:hypothetical protein